MFSSLTASANNVELFRPVNTKGDPISITFGDKHPYQEQLMQLISQASLPNILKNELLGDLKATSVMYSNELLTYAETQRQILLTLSKLTKTTTKSADGTTKESVSEEYSATEAASTLGIHIAPYQMAIAGIDANYVAAFTQRGPSRVVYFSELIKQMPEDEVLRLVLHEQAHRLSYLEPFWNNERFIEGWSSLLLSYLKGQTTKDEFFAVLKTNGLPSRDVVGLNGAFDDVSKQYRARINVVIPQTAIHYRGLLKTGKRTHYIIQVTTKDAFPQYPDLQTSELAQINLPQIETQIDYEHVHRELDKEIEDGELELPLLVFYDQDPQPDSTGRLRQVVKVNELRFDPTDRIRQIETRLKDIVKTHDKALVITTFDEALTNCNKDEVCDREFTTSVFGTDHFNRFFAVIERLGRAFKLIQRESPALYSELGRPYRKWLVLTTRDAKLEAVAQTEGWSLRILVEAIGRLVINIPLSTNLDSLSTRNIADLISIAETGASSLQWKALTPANRVLNSKVAQFEPDKLSSIRDLKDVNTFWKNSPKLLSIIRCVPDGIFDQDNHLSVKLEIGGSGISWNFTSTADDERSYKRRDYVARPGTELKLRVSRALLKGQPDRVREFILNTVFNARSYSPVWDSEPLPGEAIWHPESKKIKKIQNEQGFRERRRLDWYFDDCKKGK